MKIGYDAKRMFHNNTGLGNYSRDLVRILATYYPDNEYYLYNPKPAKINRLALTSQMVVKQPENWLSQKLHFLWRSKWITKDIINDQLDIFHGLSGELPFGINKTGVKSVVTIHDLIFIHFPELYKPIDRKIYTAKFKHAAHNADKIVAISEQTKNDLVKFFKISPEKIHVIYQGCHNAFKQSYSDELKNAVKDKFGLPDSFILNVGTIEARKNAFSIVKAIKGNDYQLVLVGRKTAYYNEIEAYIKQHNLSAQVHFLEGLNLEELAILYQLADIFIYPSIYEGFGIPIIEAMFSKTPVITNKYGVFPEAAGPYSYYLDDVTDPNEIQNKIEEVYEHDSRERIANSYAFVQKFNDDVIAKKWHKIYIQTLQKSYL